ncbi:MAG: MFS transporter [Caldilinea sp. CFX5]|nr:MFS transporter [Caldilinea sp. CFX5]
MSSINRDLSSPGVNTQQVGWQPALLLIFAQFAAGLRDMPQFAFFLIYLQEQLVLSPVTISTVVAGAQIASMVAALWSGAVTARLGSKWVMVGGLALSGLSSLVFQLDAFWVVALLWVTGGAGAALVTVGSSSYLTRLSRQGTLGILAAVYALSMTIGGAIGNPIAGVLIEQAGFGRFGWTAVALTVTTTLILACWMPNLHDYAAAPVGLRAFGASLLPTLRQPTVRLLIGLRGLPTLFYGTLTVLIPLLLNELSGSKVTIAAYGTATLVLASVAQLLAGKAADRWGAQRPTLVAYGTIIVVGCGLFFGAGRVETLFFFGVLGIAAAWSLSTLMYVWVADGLPREEHPATFGLLHAVWSLCMIGGSLIGGWLVRLTPGLPFLVGALLNVGACLLVVLYYRQHASAATAQPLSVGD